MTPPADLSGFAPDARGFLADLEANNRRDWFRRERARYDAKLRRPAEQMLERIAPLLSEAAGRPVRPKLFRQHRDLRFSEDKSPFFTHLHMAWTLPDGRGWYFGLSTGYASAGAGIRQFDTAQQARWETALTGPDAVGPGVLHAGPDARFEPSAPPELAQRTGCVLWHDGLYEELCEDPIGSLTRVFMALAPLQAWLETTLCTI